MSEKYKLGKGGVLRKAKEDSSNWDEKELGNTFLN